MDWISENVGSLLDIVAKVVAVAAAIAAIVPNASGASGVISAVRKIVDLLALNVGNAKNETPTEE
tara:strand:- start:100 stop:294 length:195 start_codon:yes stop_codon:yes gene_type:complete